MAFKMYGTMERLDGVTESVIHFIHGNSLKEELRENTIIKPEYNMPVNPPTEIKVGPDLIRSKKTNSETPVAKTFVCNYCSRAFSQNYHLARHERIHTGERPYPCSWCEKRFQRNEHLTRHVRIHTGEKPYSCTYCQKQFRRNDHLGKHVRTHTTSSSSSTTTTDDNNKSQYTYETQVN